MKSVEDAINSLYDLSIIGEMDAGAVSIPRKNPLPAWLRQQWTFSPMEDIRERYELTEQRRQKALDRMRKAQGRKALKPPNKPSK
jgi:hypothetical protein